MPPPVWACPQCLGPLRAGTEAARCSSCATTYRRRGGIWRFLPAQRAAAYASFAEQYEIVRREEGWGHSEGAYYRSLPIVQRDDPNRNIWRVRGATFRSFLRCILAPLERSGDGPLRVVDVGAGNGWLAYQLTSRGHRPAAVDLRTDAFDGLGAHVHYDRHFDAIQADFNALPLGSSQFDLAVFNGSLHYSRDCQVTIEEALRVLRPGGMLVVMDSPIYRRRQSGERMVRQRARAFTSRFGFAGDAVSSEHFLTHERLHQLADAANLSWSVFRPALGMRWMLRPVAARLLGRGEPADHFVLAAEKPSGDGGSPSHGREPRQRLLFRGELT
jgi:SAM-dependent methyltransferase